ncbi:hypothetical protein [Aerosticca soli]|jgi:hypothetical protein|uniref:Uncharacterized protein n=1 Tax=Aerosticca soli TaxID=2010829 RepID=A0A2Z6E1Y0_9GAMM|nr:hypothetical protein [Aerosticca soli]MDI3259132.1 hypothetical protein [Nevskiaceae bacterium]BBD78754.1 hypothetical protein ALSL_0075 [Aerosticca soli]
MSDLLIRHIDAAMVERIKTLARERRWTINDVVLHALRSGLGLAAAGQISAETLLDSSSLVLPGQWDASEKAAFQEAMQALSAAPSPRFANDQD